MITGGFSFCRIRRNGLRTGRISAVVGMFLVTLLLPLHGVEAVSAETPFVVTSFVQRDADGNGKPDTAEIRCQCYSSDDRITVIDGTENMSPATTIEAGTDMEDDLWLFDVGNRGQPFGWMIVLETTETPRLVRRRGDMGPFRLGRSA